MDLGELARILSHLQTPPPPSSATKPRHPAPRWLVNFVSELQQLSQEPRYPDSSRIVPEHLRNASTAAWHLLDPGVLRKDPGSLKRYLRALGIPEYMITPDYTTALWELIREEAERPIASSKGEPWLADHEKTVNYLRIKLPKRVRLNDRPKAGAMRTANLGKLFTQNYGSPSGKRHRKSPGDAEQDYPGDLQPIEEDRDTPTHLEDFVGGKEGVELLEWWTPARREEFLEEVRKLMRRPHKILGRQQYRVLELGLKGKTDGEIAATLGINTSTVQSHRSAALKQPGLRLLAKKWHKKYLKRRKKHL